MKTKMNKHFLLLLLTMSLLLSFAGCGRKNTVATEAPEDITAGFEAKKDYVQTTKDDTLIYRLPDESSEVYGKLKTGVDLNRTGAKKLWTRIRLNDTTLYVKSANVKETTIEWVTEQKKAENSHVVYIDPGKQINASKETEALAPGEADEDGKPKMSPASVGTASGKFEYEITLAVAKKLKRELEMRGYEVILSRETDTVSISNAERVANGNRSDAEIIIRLSAHASTNSDSHGIFSLIASATNPNTNKNYQDSFYLANMLVTDACMETDANRLGIYQTDKTVFLNFAKKPAAIVQLGFLSNAEEDTKLATEEYQTKLADGLADGIDSYFEYYDGKSEDGAGGKESDPK